MLASADRSNHYLEETIYDSEWTENIPTGISWFNLLTSQPIPEEMDGTEDPCTLVRNHSESDCSSSSSIESCYVVLEIQRPHSVTETPSKVEVEEVEEEEVEVEEEEEEEEEEIVEEMEELNFAQLKTDHHNVEYDQLAVSMTVKAPMEEYVVKRQQEQVLAVEEYAHVTEPIVQQMSHDILFRKAKALSRFTKRMKAMSYASMKDPNLSTSSDDESPNITKLKTIHKIHEYHPITISTVAAEKQYISDNKSNIQHLTTSLDSIENKSLPSSPVRPRITTTFSNLSSQRPLNPIQIPRPSPTMGTTSLTRTFAFDRACMERYGRVSEQKNDLSEIPLTSVSDSITEEETQSPNKSTEVLQHSDHVLNCRSFTNTISTPFYIGSESSTIDDIEFNQHSSAPQSASLSKASSVLCLMKKCTRIVTSEYRLSHNNNNEDISAEPTLLQVKYLDGRVPLNVDYNRESFGKPQTLSGSISNRLNRLGLQKMLSTQDLSTTPTTASLNGSYRKRMFSRFRTLMENNSTEQQQQQQSRPWQHKTLKELFAERKYKVNRP